MSCSNRRNNRYRDIAVVRVLAQATANATKTEQKLYKIICDGVQVFRFSTDWKGSTVEVIRPNGQHSGTSILSDNEQRGRDTVESIKPKVTKKVKFRGDMD